MSPEVPRRIHTSSTCKVARVAGAHCPLRCALVAVENAPYSENVSRPIIVSGPPLPRPKNVNGVFHIAPTALGKVTVLKAHETAAAHPSAALCDGAPTSALHAAWDSVLSLPSTVAPKCPEGMPPVPTPAPASRIASDATHAALVALQRLQYPRHRRSAPHQNGVQPKQQASNREENLPPYALPPSPEIHRPASSPWCPFLLRSETVPPNPLSTAAVFAAHWGPTHDPSTGVRGCALDAAAPPIRRGSNPRRDVSQPRSPVHGCVDASFGDDLDLLFTSFMSSPWPRP